MHLVIDFGDFDSLETVVAKDLGDRMRKVEGNIEVVETLHDVAGEAARGWLNFVDS
jgi:hypothetical protein